LSKIKVMSLFTGVGGFELALSPEDFQIVAQSEIDKHKCAILEYRYPEVKNYGDITKGIDYRGEIDLIVGGSPCTSFSIAGLKEGFAGKSGLFTYFSQQIKIFTPKYFIWENVKGTLNSSRGWDFVRVQNHFLELGYDFRWLLLNAADYGIPQGRERIYVVGVHRESKRETEFLRKKVFRRPNKTIKNDCEGTKSFIRTMHLKQNGRIYSEIAPTITLKEFPNLIQQVDGVDLVRTTTIRELEKLMTWPADWTKWGIYDGVKREVPITYRKQMTGDGVISKIVEDIVNQLILGK